MKIGPWFLSPVSIYTLKFDESVSTVLAALLNGLLELIGEPISFDSSGVYREVVTNTGEELVKRHAKIDIIANPYRGAVKKSKKREKK